MPEIDFLSKVHRRTKRDYLHRVLKVNRAECARIMKRWDFDYWDGSRDTGFGGYVYDGRWRAVAEEMVKHYDLRSGMRILDVGCGRAHLLYEFTQVVPGIQVAGIDISGYGIETAKEEVRPYLKVGHANSLPWPDDHFDFVLSLNVLHNMEVFDLYSALKEMQRVGKSEKKYIVVESWRSEEEKANMLYWAIPCESFYSPQSWKWMFDHAGYVGDYSYITFE
jgi:ubiquinone/menaquinone biosynthesis C-methylase UbiE